MTGADDRDSEDMTPRDPPVDGGDGPAMIAILITADPAAADECALVLRSMGIACAGLEGDGGVAVLVAAEDAARAQDQLRLYAGENRIEARPAVPAPGIADGIGGAAIYAGGLVVLHLAAHGDWLFPDWFAVGAARAGRIVDGEWWRAVTALGLHGDAAHLAGNLVFGVVFGLLVAQTLGAGLAWLVIVAGGAAGNVLNALLQPPWHSAVGASTAVFAAVGTLSALMLTRRHGFWRRGLRRWSPLAAGLMLLAFLGVGGERTDVVAHATGFAAGGILGLAVGRIAHRLPMGLRLQRAFGGAALAAVALAWAVAFACGRS